MTEQALGPFASKAETDAQLVRLWEIEAAAQFRCNVLVSTVTDSGGRRFAGEWVAVPRADFETLRAALAQPEGAAAKEVLGLGSPSVDVA